MTNPKSQTAPVVMDARKFVRQINNSAAARVKFFEESISRMGKSVGKNLRLTSLDANSIIYEDADKNLFYVADIKKGARGKVELENVRLLQIVEEDKATQFDKNVGDLVNHICEGNLTQADKVFNKIESQRFRSRVIPESGWITLKDGVARHIPVATRIVQEDHVQNIVKLFSESVRDSVEVDKGRIIRGTLSDGQQKFVIPINEYTRRRLVAFKMRDAAMEAYKSPAFQNIVMECASLVCEGKVKDAVKVAVSFLKEEQEFSLLNADEMKSLVEHALATKTEFNSMLAEDVAKVFYKTSVKVNREAILEAWTKVAQTSEHAGLLANVNTLSESKEFESDYGKFLDIIFNEELDIQSARAKAYRTTLRVIASILPDLEDEDGEEVTASVDELNELIERLSGPEPDTDAVLQAEELLAGISDSLIDSIQDLEGFDRMPGEEEAEEEPEGDLVPLPEVGAEEEEEGGEEEEALPPPPPEGKEEEKKGPPLPPMESIQHRLVPVEQMKSSQLNEELEDWRVHGQTFLKEHGYDQCYSDMERYIKRCIALGPTANTLRENFEQMRDRLVDTGDEVLEDLQDDDPYSESVMAALNGPNKLLENKSKLNRDYRHTYMEGEQPYELSGGLSDAGGLAMDDLQGSGGVATASPTKSDGRSAGGSAAGYHAKQRGQGVAQKGAKPVDGRSGEKSTSGAAGGSTRMDELQGGGGVQKQGLHTSDGRKGQSTAGPKSESTVKAHGGVPSTDLSMGSDFQGKGGVQAKSLDKADGASGDGADSAKGYTASGGPSAAGHNMGENQGKGGVEKSSLGTVDPKGQGKVSSDGGLKKASRGGDMSKLQGSGGVAESITPDRIAEIIAEMDGDDLFEEWEKPWEKEKDGAEKDESKKEGEGEKPEPAKAPEPPAPPASEDQFKGPSRKKSGLKRASMNPAEAAEKSDAALSENKVAAFIGSPEDVAAAVDQALGDSEGDMGMGDVPAPPVTEVSPPVSDEVPDMGEEEEGEGDLEDALDSALGGDEEEEVPSDVDEVAAEGAGESEAPADDSEESEDSDSESESSACEKCDCDPCECE